MWKRGAISPLFHIILYNVYIFLTSGVKLHIHLLNVVVQFIVFLTLSTLIYRGMDISKCFSESLGIRDNESRLYIEKFKNLHVRNYWTDFNITWQKCFFGDLLPRLFKPS